MLPRVKSNILWKTKGKDATGFSPLQEENYPLILSIQVRWNIVEVVVTAKVLLLDTITSTMTIPAQPFIVYCDDDEDDLFFLRESLEGHCPELRLQTFVYGPEALRFLEQLAENGCKPSLVILDINMHPLSGKELLVFLRANRFYDDVPLVLFTTSSMSHDQQFASKHNASFITKPMHVAQIKQVAETILGIASEKIR